MKLSKNTLFIIGIVYGLMFLGIFIFYMMNPFGNECVKEDCQNGYGVFIYSSGMKYEGEWKNGLRHGKGTLTYPDIYTYSGEWKNNKKDGYGTQTYYNGAHYIDKYEGLWKNGNMHGKGTISYSKGAKYVGTMKNGNRHGYGTITYSDGRVFMGEWIDNKPLFDLPKQHLD